MFDKENLKVKRLAKQRKRLDKYSLLMFLQKNELKRLSKIKNSNNLSTDEIRRLIVSRLTIGEIRQAA